MEKSNPASVLQPLAGTRVHVELFSQDLSALRQGVRNNQVSQIGFASGAVELSKFTHEEKNGENHSCS